MRCLLRAVLATPTGWLAAGMLALALHSAVMGTTTHHPTRLCIDMPSHPCPTWVFDPQTGTYTRGR